MYALHHYTITPLGKGCALYTITPLHLFVERCKLYTITPLHLFVERCKLYTITPLHPFVERCKLYTITPLHPFAERCKVYTITPLHHFTITPPGAASTFQLSGPVCLHADLALRWMTQHCEDAHWHTFSKDCEWRGKGNAVTPLP